MDLDSLPRAAGAVIPSALARAAGVSATLLTARDAGRLVAVRRGVYVPSAGRDELASVVRHREMAFAVAHQRPRVVFAGITAAVLSGMPIVGGAPHDVVVLATGSSGRRRNGVVEIVRRTDAPTLTDDGIAVTPVVDTLIEVARSRPQLTALTMADAALWVPRFGSGHPATTIEALRDAFEARLPFPGSRRVAAVLDRASSRAETPLETLSRLRIEELGFPAPELQLRVDRPHGRGPAFLDFAWPDHGVWGEADGGGKYLGSGVVDRVRRSPAEIVRDEKERENDVRSVTGWTCGRWDWDEAWNGGALRRILLQAGLPLVRAARR
ncbi:hypothetical protein [Agromyces mariniharenae]|uniref:Transcriptional regulator, AbiEi antitoxin, Type IV TA system n=1 Tax=Agromyces mariniharenae TaxID=2604423 RepID=A0A5S4V595_9MICO|nr:hypothetical protein [Agromyces mariniharenae]TYL52421.1 hypothetical protein FYC51_01250 [Agromyces mariniharenae]